MMKSVSKLNFQIHHFEHEWKIDHFPMLIETYGEQTVNAQQPSILFKMNSAKFGSLKDDDNKFECHLDLHTNSNHSVNLNLYVSTNRFNDPSYKLPIKFWFSIHDANGNQLSKKEGAKKFSNNCKNTGFAPFITFTTEQLKQSCETITIRCEVKCILDQTPLPITSTTNDKIEPNLPPVTLPNWNRLWKSGQLSDVIIVVNGNNNNNDNRKYRAHKNILALHSPVFAAMFAHTNTTEAKTNVVNIDDYDQKVIELMLGHIYTGTAGGVSLSLEQSLERSLVKELFLAANKYQIDWLQREYAKHLCSTLTKENTMDTLALANACKANEMKQYCEMFASKNVKVGQWKVEELINEFSNNLAINVELKKITN